MRYALAALALVMALAAAPPAAAAQTTASSPTGGHYRVGRYVAIQIDAPPARELLIQAEGLLPARVAARGDPRISGTFPMLVVSPPSDAITIVADGKAESLPIPLRAIDANERVVGVVGDVEPFARDLFPGKTIVPVSLDPARPLAGSPAAWDVLDAVVVDGPTTFDETSVRFLLAAGVTFAVRSPATPDAMWPWRREGDWWTLRYQPLGPAGGSFDATAAAYAPAANWKPGTLPATRRNGVLLAVLFSIVMLGMSLLLRGKWRAIGFVVLAGGAVLAFSAFARRQPALREASGGVVVLNADLRQSDSWLYQTGVRATPGLVGFNALTRPMLLSPEHTKQLGLRLVCSPDGRPEFFETHPSPGRAIGFHRRAVNPDKTGGTEVRPLATNDSPLRALLPLYAAPDARVVGEGPPGKAVSYIENWPTVIIDRRPKETIDSK